MSTKGIFSHIRSRGFTIVEVVVVIVVISILAGIGGAAYSNYQSRADNDTRANRAQIIANAIERYYSQNGEYPSVHMLIAGPGNTAQNIAERLEIDEVDIVDPSAPDGTTVSIVNYEDYAASTDTVFRYRGYATNTANCRENDIVYNNGSVVATVASLEPVIAALIPGYCEAFILSYRDTVDNTWQEIRSQNNPSLY